MKISGYVIAIVLATCCLSLSQSKNILGLFPHPGFSHFKVFYPILQRLAKNGHNLTVVSYVKSKNTLPNYRELILTGEDTIHLFNVEMFEPSRSFVAMLYEFYMLSMEGRRACKAFYESNAIAEILLSNRTDPFDLVITENFNTDCHLGIPYILNVPTIGLSSCAVMPWHYERFGLPDTPSYIPSEFVGFNENMSFYERFVNFVITKMTALLYRITTQVHDNKVVKEHLKIDVDVNELAKTQSLLLVNQHYSLSGSKPLPSRVIEVGGVHIDDNYRSEIPKNVEEFLEQSSNGVLFVSWGSMVKMSTLSKSKVKQIVNALEKIPLNILWKWESDRLPTDSKKFMFTKWAPQKELLCHPKVKVFWSHGGLLGVSESTYCGKPLIISPLYGDQFLNGKAVENRNMGIMLYHNEMYEENLLKAFEAILEPKYARNANYVSSVYRNRPNSPLDTAVWWIEHTLNTAGNNLTYSPAIHMNGFVYHSLDVLGLMCAIVILIFVITVRLCRKCFPKSNALLAKKKKVKFN